MPKVINAITKQEVARWFGMHPQNYGQFLRGNAGVSIKRLETMSKLTGVSTDDILKLRGSEDRILHLRFRDAYRRREE